MAISNQIAEADFYITDLISPFDRNCSGVSQSRMRPRSPSACITPEAAEPVVVKCWSSGRLTDSRNCRQSASNAAKADPVSPATGITVLKRVRSSTSRTREFAPANVKRPPAFLVIVV